MCKKMFTLEDIALLMARMCVRDTVLEDYHSGNGTVIGNKEMKIFMKQVVNKIYTFLKLSMFSGTLTSQEFLASMQWMIPLEWDKPRMDPSFRKGIKQWKSLCKMMNEKQQGAKA
jgi:hypothetical protein